MRKRIITLITLVALMYILALCCAEWDGIFVVEGILTGIAMAIAVNLDKERREKRGQK